MDSEYDSELKDRFFMLIQLCFLKGADVLDYEEFIKKVKNLSEGK